MPQKPIHTTAPPNSQAAVFVYKYAGSLVSQGVALSHTAAMLNYSTHSPLYSGAAGNSSGQWVGIGEEAFEFLVLFGSFCNKAKTNKEKIAAASGYEYTTSLARYGVSWRHTVSVGLNQRTNTSGNVNQHLQYMPFGETFVNQRNSNDIRFKFTGKEKDSKTGYTYFGARCSRHT